VWNSSPERYPPGTVPVEVTTDPAPVYPQPLDELVPSAMNTVAQYANNPIDYDHGRFKAPGSDLCADSNETAPPRSSPLGTRSCRTRRGQYQIATDAPEQHRRTAVSS
jgi:transposase, IS6 family